MKMRAKSEVLYHLGLPGMSSEIFCPLMTRLSKVMFDTLRVESAAVWAMPYDSE